MEVIKNKQFVDFGGCQAVCFLGSALFDDTSS